MEFVRKITTELIAWKNQKQKNSALLIEGARRVGKTTAVLNFGKRFYRDYIYIDFQYASAELKKLFERIDPSKKEIMDMFFADLFLLCGKILNPGDLIIFDEVQHCPKARESIKALVADGRFDYIETGSLISIENVYPDFQIPSEERRLEMHPLDYEEFLWAIYGSSAAEALKQSFIEGRKIENRTHKKLLDDYRLYLCLGGMPKVVSIYLETQSFMEAEKEKQDIIKLYRDDLRKHDNRVGTRCLELYDLMIPSLLSFSGRAKNKIGISEKQRRILRRSLIDLADSKVCNVVYRTSNVGFGMESYKDETMFKIYPADAGLMLSSLLANDSPEATYKKIRFGKLESADLGRLYECETLQSLVSSGLENVFYHVFDYKDKSYEIDFLYTSKGKAQVVECKSTKRFLTPSLDAFQLKYPQIKARRIVVSPKPFAPLEGGKINVPFYDLTFLFENKN